MATRAETWLVVSNCNRIGIANSLKLLRANAEVTVFHIHAFKGAVQKGEVDVSSFRRMIAHPEIFAVFPASKKLLSQAYVVPGLFFGGYHPDMCYVRAGKEAVPGPVGDYHSAICLAAYKAGLSADETFNLFCDATYSGSGYYDAWAWDRAAQQQKFAGCDIHLSEFFPQWSKFGPFMHTVNHPPISCIFDIVRFVLQREGIKIIDPPLIPHDNLQAMPGFPVFPEIAEVCGVAGSLHFPIGDYNLIPLRAVVRRSFKIYDRYEKESLLNRQAQLPRFQGLERYLASDGAPVR